METYIVTVSNGSDILLLKLARTWRPKSTRVIYVITDVDLGFPTPREIAKNQPVAFVRRFKATAVSLGGKMRQLSAQSTVCGRLQYQGICTAELVQLPDFPSEQGR